jgi:hypothetical protein
MVIFSKVLIVIFVALAASHLVMAYRRIVKRKRSSSSIPLVNGLIGSAGIYLLPDPAWAKWWWVPFIVDWGCVPLAVEWVIWKMVQPKEGH